MKISFIEPHLKVYGGIRRIIELANRLTKRGHDVTIFHSDGSPCGWIKCVAKVKSYDEVLKEKHDVIIFNDPNPIDYNLTKKAKAKMKIFYVLELYNKSLLKGTNLKRYFPWNRRMLILKKCLRSPYLKLSNATWEKEWLKENMNIDSVLLIGGVNTKMFYPVGVKKNPNEVRLLCSGDPRERKGTKTILEAVKIAKKEEPRIVLDTYHGKGIPQEKMAEKYSSADIFVEASWQAGWNNPVAEAMACKVPVISTDIGGVKDFAFHEKTALIVSSGDAQAMASAILRLINDEELRETLRENAYSHIRQFDWDKSAKRLEELSRKKDLFSKIHIAIHNPKKILNRGEIILRKVLKGGSDFDKYIKFGAYHWNSYKNDPIYSGHVDHIIDNFGGKAKGTLLDVGCGDGLISSFLAEKGFKVKGIDKEGEGIRLAQRKSSSVDFEVKDIFDVHEQFDYLLASEVIEHLSIPDEFLQKIKGLFRREALITTPKRDYYKEPDPYHFREYSIYEFENLLKKYFKRFQVQVNEYHLYGWIKK
jgi:glycosyltransferase involved in cell wall biosynthesis